MGGHYFGKFLIEVTLSNGERAFLMDVEDGYVQVTRNRDAAARFLTEAGAKKYYYSVYHMYLYSDPSVYITNGFVKKTTHF